MKKIFNKELSKVILIIAIFTFTLQVNANSNISPNQNYRVQFDSEDVLLNTTQMMTRGDIVEINITITGNNTTLTLITEILNNSGRLWGLYIENASYYYSSKETEHYAGFVKLMDHVSNYTVKHVIKTPGDYVLAFHDSHLHEEPDTYFNTLVLNGTFGQETTIIADQTQNMSSNATTTSFSTIFTLIGIFSFGCLIRFRKISN